MKIIFHKRATKFFEDSYNDDEEDDIQKIIQKATKKMLKKRFISDADAKVLELLLSRAAGNQNNSNDTDELFSTEQSR